MGREDRVAHFAREAAESLLAEHEEDLRDFRVEMDRWQRESELYQGGAVEETLEELEERGLTYREEGALWLRTTEMGDEKDRVLVKSDGSYTYFLPDIAYHVEKARRGFDRALDVLGADHHGHVPRMKGALEALDLGAGFLEVVLIQLVTVLRGGEEVRMSKRAGEFVTLRELYDETGVDVARYFFLMRRAEVPLQFDLDLALDTSEKNPVYKIQYAHARMCSVFDRAGADPETVEAGADELARLETEAERTVMREVLRFPSVVLEAAEARAPYQVCTYLEEFAGAVNSWYHEGNVDPELRVLAEGPARTARMALARAVQITLRNGLWLLGLDAPERMARRQEDEA
jgi:arginyl-tRNA synthetase